MVGIDENEAAAANGARGWTGTFFGRGRVLKCVVLPLKALMLMVSLGEAATEGKVGFKDMVDV